MASKEYTQFFQKVMRPFVRERDDYQCQVCESPENGQSHDVHHINYEKTDDSEGNLILLCRPCHANTNTLADRMTWSEICRERIWEIYGGFDEEKIDQLANYLEDLRSPMGSDGRRPHGFWLSQANAIAVALEVKDRFGLSQLPSTDDLNAKGYSSLNFAINKYHGGMNNFRRLLGEDVLIRSAGEHRSLDEVLYDVRQIMSDKGYLTMPRADIIVSLGHSDLVRDIHFHGGVREIRKALNEEQKRTARGQWQEISYVITEAERIMKEHGFDELPSSPVLQELGEASFYDAVHRYHGGIRNVREILGQEQKEKPKGYWKAETNIKAEAERIMEKHGLDKLPGSTILGRMGYLSFVAAANIYHGGIRNLRDKLGQDQVIRAPGTWKSLEFALEQAEAVIKDGNLDSLPGTKTLTKIGRSDLANAITKHHGGMMEFRKALGESQKRTDSEKLRDETYMVERAREIMEAYGTSTLPGQHTLNEEGYSGFVNAVNRHHGGMRKFRTVLGGKQLKKPDGYWNEWENVRTALIGIMIDLEGRFPLQKELQAAKLGSVAVAISKKHGGVEGAKQKLREEGILPLTA